MIYPKKFQRQKTVFTLVISTVMIALSLGVGFLVNPSLISTNTTTTTAPRVTPTPVAGEFVMTDEALIRAIKNELGIEDRALTKEDVESLTVLDCTAETVKDVTGLEYAIHLKELKIKTNAKSFEPLTGLYIEKLTVRSVYSAQPLVEDISKMQYLTYIDMTDCGVSVIGFFSELPMIQTLILDNNRISDLEYVSDMRLLTRLSLRNCGLTNITALYGNNTLRYLYLDDNKLTTKETIDSMSALIECTYSGNPIAENDK